MKKEKVKANNQSECRICGEETSNRFNINFSIAPICEYCAISIYSQQSEWLIKKKTNEQ